MIEGVEELRAEFELGSFARPVELELLDERNVPIVLAGAFEYTDACVSKTQCRWIIGAEDGRSCKALGIDITVKVTAHATGGSVMTRLAGSRDARTIVHRAVDAVSVGKSYRQIAARLRGNHPCDGPTAERLPSDRTLLERNWELIVVVDDKTVLSDEEVRTVALGRIVLVANALAAVRAHGRREVGGKIFGESVGSLERQAVAELLGQADQERVVPRSAGRLDLLHTGWVPSLERNAQWYVRECVRGLSANRIGRAGQVGLIDGALANLVQASRA